MKNRIIYDRLRAKADSRFGRIVAVTGARQTGKTTVTRQAFPGWDYISLDDPVVRPDYLRLSVPEWQARHPRAILDEIQKAPALFESLKGLHDRYPDTRYAITGSSQILLQQGLRETLAGRLGLVEIFPLTITERLTDSWSDPVVEPLLVRVLRTGNFDDARGGMPGVSDRFAQAAREWERYAQTGGYPALVGEAEAPAREWLRDYVRTYLQRDVRDLAQIRDLEPFAAAQIAAAHVTGNLLNYASLARTVSITPQTAQRFLHYLALSFQVILLPPWFRNPLKRLRKAPKLHFLDPGVLRTLTRRMGPSSGAEFESAVVAEVHKLVRSYDLPVDLYHLSTLDGRETDLLLELGNGYVALEIKAAARADATDARHLRGLEGWLDKPLLARWVVTAGSEVREIAPGVIALPAPWLFS